MWITSKTQISLLKYRQIFLLLNNYIWSSAQCVQNLNESSSSNQTCYSCYFVYLFEWLHYCWIYQVRILASHLTSLDPLITRSKYASSLGFLDYIFFIIQNYLLFSFFTNSFLGWGSQCASTGLSTSLLTSFSNINFVLINSLSRLCKNKLSTIFPYQLLAQDFSMAFHDCDTLKKWP